MTYAPIKSEEGELYNPEKFKGALKTLRALEGGLEAIVQDPNNPDANSLVGQTLREDPQFYYNSNPQNPGVGARLEATYAQRDGEKGLTGYVMKYASEISSGLNADQMKSFFRNVKVETGEENLKKYVSALNDAKEASEAAQDPQKMISYVSKKLTGEPDWAKASFGYLSGSEHYIQRLFQDYFREASKKLEEQENALQEDDFRKLVAENVNKAVEKKDRKFFRVLAEIAVPPENQH